MGVPLRPARRASGALVAALATLAAGILSSRAAVRVDPAFGTRGIVVVGHGSELVSAVAATPDRRILVAGSASGPGGEDLLVARFLPDGSPDPSFAREGRARIDLGGSERASALAVDADGSAFVLLTSVVDGRLGCALVRSIPGGGLDAAFGDGGVLRLRPAAGEDLRAIGLASAGGDLVVAARVAAGRGAGVALFRADERGRLDRGFGSGGVARRSLAPPVEGGGVAVDGRGRVLVLVASGGDWTVLRFLESGGLDPSFGRDGVATLDLGGREVAGGIAVAADGGIVLAGASRRGTRSKLAVARLLADGRPDPSFATNGRFVRDLGGGNERAQAVLVDGAGRVVLAGVLSDGARDRMLVARLRADGEPDEAFGAGGLRVVAAAGASAGADAIALAPDGALLVAGRAAVGAGEAGALFRLVEREPACGDGVLDRGEECDPGPAPTGSEMGCCTAGCRLRPRGVVCRPAVGGCDVAESCDGASPLCPPDRLAGAGRLCRAAAGACDAPELCDGRSAACPADRRLPAGRLCRPAAGPCDLPESCDGESAACPEDRKGRQLCRAAVSPCDAPERCDGAHDECPEDAVLDEGSACLDGDPCTFGESCRNGRCEGGEYDEARCGGLLCFRVRAVGRSPLAQVRRLWLTDALSSGVERLLPPSRGGGEPRPRAVCVSARVGVPEIETDGWGPGARLGLAWASYAARRVTKAAPASAGHGGRRRAGSRGPRRRKAKRAKADHGSLGLSPTPAPRAGPKRRRREVLVSDVFGRFSLVPGSPRYVGVPSWLGGSEPRGLPPAPEGAAHYRCYSLGRRGFARRFRRSDVPIAIPGEGRVEAYDVRSPSLLCAPASAAPSLKGPAPAAPPEAPLLLCHSVSGPRRSEPAAGPLAIRSRVGALSIERLSARALCVPARLEEP